MSLGIVWFEPSSALAGIAIIKSAVI